MAVLNIEKKVKGIPGAHARQVETYSLSRFMDGLHSEEEGQASESDRNAESGEAGAV